MNDIAQRLRARAPDDDENCVTSCIYAAAAQANCGTDIHCICTSSAFRNAALTCLNATCTPLDYDTVLDTVLGACASGGLDAVSSLTDAFLSSATRTAPGAPTSTRGGGSGSNTNAADDDDGGGGSSNIGAIVGGVVGGLALVALFAGLIWFLVRRARKPKPVVYAQPYSVPPGAPGTEPKTPGGDAPPMTAANVGAGAYGSGYPSMYSGAPTSTYNTGAHTSTATYSTGAPTSTYSTSVSSPTMPSPQPASASELGYVPPQSFAMYGPPPGAQQPQYPGGGYAVQQPSTGDYAYRQNLDAQQPYNLTLEPQRASLYAGPAAAATVPQQPWSPADVPQQQQWPPADAQQSQWPADVKRPLQVMSAESETAGAGSSYKQEQQEQEMAPPPVYRQ